MGGKQETVHRSLRNEIWGEHLNPIRLKENYFQFSDQSIMQILVYYEAKSFNSEPIVPTHY